MIANMLADPAAIDGVVREVIAQIRRRETRPGDDAPTATQPPVSHSRLTLSHESGPHRDGERGVFRSVNDAVTAAVEAYEQLRTKSLDDRRRAIARIRRICIEQADELGRHELAETKIGRLEHKIDKLKMIGERIPGVEFLRSEAASGDHGLTVTEFGPFGVIGVVTPVTHSLPTLAANAINMIAAGNTLVVNPHPAGARIACEGARRFNDAIRCEIGIEDSICVVEQPTLETAQAIFEHRGVRLLCVTGGPGVARAALGARKRAIVAGPGNPPVVVDETADIDNAAKSIIAGAAYDNNLLCIGEKQVFVVEAVFDALTEALARHGAVRLESLQVESLTNAALQSVDEKGGAGAGSHGRESVLGTQYSVCDTPRDAGRFMVNKELLGQDATLLAESAGVRVPAETVLLFGETAADHPFVQTEQMMPFIPLVRTRDVGEAIRIARASEHGYRHTSVIHSRDVRAMTAMGRELETTIFVKNGPCYAGLGIGGEGFCSFSIAGPTGEGPTSPLTFTRQRRCAMVDALRIV